MKAFTIPKGYGVQYKMVVQMPTIQVGGNYHLEPISPEFSRKLHTNLDAPELASPPQAAKDW